MIGKLKMSLITACRIDCVVCRFVSRMPTHLCRFISRTSTQPSRCIARWSSASRTRTAHNRTELHHHARSGGGIRLVLVEAELSVEIATEPRMVVRWITVLQ